MLDLAKRSVWFTCVPKKMFTSSPMVLNTRTFYFLVQYSFMLQSYKISLAVTGVTDSMSASQVSLSSSVPSSQTIASTLVHL